MAFPGSLAGGLPRELHGTSRKALLARLRAFLAGPRYDAELADGIRPTRSICHAARAGRITRPRACRMVAQALKRALEAAELPPGPNCLTTKVPVDCRCDPGLQGRDPVAGRHAQHDPAAARSRCRHRAPTGVRRQQPALPAGARSEGQRSAARQHPVCGSARPRSRGRLRRNGEGVIKWNRTRGNSGYSRWSTSCSCSGSWRSSWPTPSSRCRDLLWTRSGGLPTARFPGFFALSQPAVAERSSQTC